MNSKECLERLYKNLGCESCHNDECKFNSVKNHCDMWTETISQDIEKLDQYKKLEEELGIDLFILFKALTNGVYVKNEYAYNEYEIEYKKVRGIEKTGLSAISNICEFPECDELLCYSNYGKFWALTKEKLENDK